MVMLQPRLTSIRMRHLCVCVYVCVCVLLTMMTNRMFWKSFLKPSV